ncbi:MAG: single-stranded DNA-binding protein, partial [Thomasclavelia ramosa]
VRCDSVQFLDTRNQNEAPMDTQKVQQMANDNYFHNGSSSPSDFMEDVNTYDIMEDDIQF